jgi:predicted anti-sigma-YlaC factor YlaD
MKLTCEDVQQKLSDDLQLQEDEQFCARVKEHLNECASCQAFRDSLGRTIGCFKDYETTPPKDLHALVLQRLKEEGLT